jgi:hypothetical protein
MTPVPIPTMVLRLGHQCRVVDRQLIGFWSVFVQTSGINHKHVGVFEEVLKLWGKDWVIFLDVSYSTTTYEIATPLCDSRVKNNCRPYYVS